MSVWYVFLNALGIRMFEMDFMKNALLAVLLLAVAAYFIESRSGWSDLYRAAGVSLDAPDADLLAQTSTTVTVLDVGQGDAVLIGQDGAYCLIDTGPSDVKGDLVRDLQLAGISKLDYLVLTHPHADHTGGAREVLRNLVIDRSPAEPSRDIVKLRFLYLRHMLDA